MRGLRSRLLTAVFSLALPGLSAAGIVGYTNNNNSLYAMDLTTGVATEIGSLGASGDFEAMAFDPTSGILYVHDDSSGSLYTADTSTGQLTLVGSGGATRSNNHGMAFSSTGQGYLVGGQGQLFSLDKTTGVAALIGSGANGISGAAFVGNTLYASPDNGSTGDLLIIDTTTGAQTSVGALGVASSSQTGLAYDALSDILYLLDESTRSIYSVDYTTGAATLIGGYGSFTFESLALPATAQVAAPASLLLVALGLLGATRRRKIA